MAELRGGSTAGGYPLVTAKEVPMIFRVDSGKLQYSVNNGATWSDAGFTGDATATASQMLSGITAYVNGVKISGTMPNHGAVNQSLAINGTYTIPAGYHNGSGRVTQSITTKGAAAYTPSTVTQTIAAGQYLTGAQTIAGSANLVAGNIRSGVDIFGVVGNVIAGKRYGTGTTTSSTITITLGWQPTVVIVRNMARGGFWVFFRPRYLVMSETYNYSPTETIYTPTYYDGVRVIYYSSTAYAFSSNVTWSATGFTVICPDSNGGTFEWFAWE